MRTQRRVLVAILSAATMLSMVVSQLSAVSAQETAAPQQSLRLGSSAQNPDPPCFDNANRYSDCGNGTVTDTATGLIWLQDAGCLGPLDWAAANQAAASLRSGHCGLRDRSRPGDWRLPSNAEWTTMTAVARTHPDLRCTNPALTDDSGSRCFATGSGSSFLNVVSADYWTSTTHSQTGGLLPDGTKAGVMSLMEGLLLSFFDKSCCPQRVWPVRTR